MVLEFSTSRCWITIFNRKIEDISKLYFFRERVSFFEKYFAEKVIKFASFTLSEFLIYINFKGIVHQFWINKFVFVSQQKKILLWKVHLDKTALTWNNWEKWCSKSVRVIYIIFITVLGRTDFEHHIFLIILSQSCFIEIDLL